MKQVLCDKCAKLVEDPNYITLGWLEVDAEIDCEPNTKPNLRFEVCESCFRDFKEWMKS